jgi:hypothetical protein
MVKGKARNSSEVIVCIKLQANSRTIELSFLPEFVLINHDPQYMREGKFTNTCAVFIQDVHELEIHNLVLGQVRLLSLVFVNLSGLVDQIPYPETIFVKI